MSRENFFTELKRRNVYKVAVAYVVVAWLLIQVATQVFPFFDIPNWVVRLVVLLIVLGFPIALLISWAFELTPEGLKRTEDVLPNESNAALERAYVRRGGGGDRDPGRRLAFIPAPIESINGVTASGRGGSGKVDRRPAL